MRFEKTLRADEGFHTPPHLADLTIFPSNPQEHHCIYLIWYEERPTRQAAFIRERRIKKWEREWKLNMIEQANPLWLDLGFVPMWPNAA